MESQATNLVILCGAVVVLAFVLYGHVLESRMLLTAPMLCLAVGVAIGPAGLAIASLDMGEAGDREAVYQIARVVLALTIMNAALQLSDGFLRRHFKSLATILLGGMVLMWLSASAVMLALGAGLMLALLIGAIVTPTDPVLAGAIVSGRIAAANVPVRLRDTIVAESAANDGLAIALLMLPLLALTRAGGGVPWGEWVVRVLLWEVLGAVLLGVLFGALAGWAYRLARRHQALQTRALVPILAALAFAVLAGVKLAGGTGLLGVFAAGLVFRRFLGDDWKNSQEHFEAVTERLVTPLFVVLVGTLLPFGEWARLGAPLALAVAGVILLRRLPAFLLLAPATPVFRDAGERAFAGWFGPIGVSAASYAALAAGRVDEPLLWPVASAVVTASVVVHGLSATPLARLLGVHEAQSRAPAE